MMMHGALCLSRPNQRIPATTPKPDFYKSRIPEFLTFTTLGLYT